MTEPERPSRTIAQKAVRGAGWSIITSVGSRALGLVGTLAITHFLVPEVIGEVSDAVVLVTTASQLSTWGFGQYLIAKPETGADVAWHVTVFHLGLGVISLALVIFLGGRLSGVLHAPNLQLYLPLLALSVFTDRLGSVPERLLIRAMKFRELGLMRTAGEIAYTVASLALAVFGLGGMAIVWANVARSALRSGLIILAVPAREWLTPHRLDGTITRAMLRFGLPFAVSTNAAFAARRWDNLVVSSLFGPHVLGSYNMAYNLADIPAVQVGEQIGDVLLPSFAHLDVDKRRDALVRATGLLGLVVFPLAVGLGAVAPTAISALLPRAWSEVAPMLVILSALSVARPVGWTVSSYLLSREKTRLMMVLGLFQVFILVASIVVLGKLGGPLWACAGVGVAFGLSSLASIAAASSDGVPAMALLRKCVPPLLACIPLAIAVLGARWAMGFVTIPALVRLCIEIAAGAAGYVAGAFALAGEQSREFLRLLRNARSKRGG